MVFMAEEKKRRVRRKFTNEFKERDVDLVLQEGLSVSKAARDHGIYESSLGLDARRRS